MRVVQSWDDGATEDVRLVEILRRCGAKAAFNLNPGLCREERSFGWVHEGREIWRLGRREMIPLYGGFEIASHSLTHPDLTNLPEDALAREVTESRSLLEDWFGKAVVGFCYPFHAVNDRVRAAVRAAGYRYARGSPEEPCVYPPADPLSFHPHCRFSAPDFWRRYEQAKKTDGVFFFWGHSYELSSDAAWRNLEAMVRSIAEDPATEWADLSSLFP